MPACRSFLFLFARKYALRTIYTHARVRTRDCASVVVPRYALVSRSNICIQTLGLALRLYLRVRTGDSGHCRRGCTLTGNAKRRVTRPPAQDLPVDNINIYARHPCNAPPRGSRCRTSRNEARNFPDGLLEKRPHPGCIPASAKSSSETALPKIYTTGGKRNLRYFTLYIDEKLYGHVQL